MSRTNLGPLTTPFAWPSQCAYVNAPNGVSLGWMAQSCVKNAPQDAPDCWPPRTSGVKTNVPLHGWGYYSPGIMCPTGFASACSSTAGLKSGFSFQFPLVPEETAVGCCPSGYRCYQALKTDTDDPFDQTCISIATDSSFAASTCSEADYRSFDQTIPASSVSTFTALAPMIMLVWQSADRNSVPSMTSTTTGSTSTSTSDSGSRQADNNLAGAAIAGISVAVTVIVMISVGALGWFCWRRRHEKKPKYDQMEMYLPQDNKPAREVPVEMPIQPSIYEASSGGYYYNSAPPTATTMTPITEQHQYQQRSELYGTEARPP